MRAGDPTPTPRATGGRRRRSGLVRLARLLGSLASASVVALAWGTPASAQGPAATFEIDGERYAFDRVICSLPATPGGELAVMARQDGLELNMSRDPSMGPAVSLYDHENPMSPSVSWEAPEPTMMPSRRRSLALIDVEGPRITVEATFTNEHTGATAAGRVVVECAVDASTPWAARVAARRP